MFFYSEKNELIEIAKGTAEKLSDYASGDFFKLNGNIYPYMEYDPIFWKNNNDYIYRLDDDENYYYIIRGEKIDEYDAEKQRATLYDYIKDYLDVDYYCNAEKEYKGARVTVTSGGPHIYIDTKYNMVVVLWAGDKGTYPITEKIAKIIDDIFADEYYSY